MSRVGKLPIVIPSGVTVGNENGNIIVSGPKGKLSYSPGSGVKVLVDAGKVVVSKESSAKQAQSNFGTTRANIQNMVIGVTQGWKRTLEMSGVGFTAKVVGPNLVLSVGFSHDVELLIPKDVKCSIAKTTIDLESPDLLSLSTYARKIRDTQPPEPYLGKGIRFANEKIRRKAGKTGKK